MAINEKALNKGHLRKLKAMRNSMTKSIGAELGVPAANNAFEKWLASQHVKGASVEIDVNAELISKTLSKLVDAEKLSLPQRGYKIIRRRGRGAKGKNSVVVTVITK